jgi:hypothetical protein
MSHKRKYAIPSTSQLKKSKVNNINWTNMISASSVRHFFLNDTIIDYLKYYNIRKLTDKPKMKTFKVYKPYKQSQNIHKIKTKSFCNFIMDEGIAYEKEIYEKIKDNFDCIKVAESYENRSEELFQKTIDYMKQGITIIYQGVLHNYSNETYGSPDLMIRSDKINEIFEYNVIEAIEEKIYSPILDRNYYYFIVDIKHSTLKLNSTGEYILNSGSIPAFKGQLLIYNLALSNVLGVDINKSFILSKSFIFGKSELGVIDYKNSKLDIPYVNRLENALSWLRSMRNEGHTWKLLPTPSKAELYPNMKNKMDEPYTNIKKELATEINELTQICNVGFNNRIYAHKKNILEWTNENCTSEALNINGKLSTRVDLILNTNRSNDLIKPDKILYDKLDWRNTDEHKMEFYLDYETCNLDTSNFIFMVGVGYFDKRWVYKCLIAKNYKNEEEMLNEFWDYVNGILLKFNKTEPVFLHWTHAEPLLYKKKMLEYTSLPDKNFIDIYNIFINEPISIKGALDYKLKSIAKAMYKNKMIKTVWKENSGCESGTDALVLAYNIYKNNDEVSLEIKEMKDIKKYNEIDCKVLYEIINYLRVNH